MCPKSGFRIVKAVQFLNVLALLEQRRISFRCFRVYLGCFALIAIRDAARRVRRRKAGRGRPAFARYRVLELARLCGSTEREVAHDLALLQRENLLSFTEREISVSAEMLPESSGLGVLVRSPTRPVPVPRAVLRFLARERRKSVSKAMIACMLRCLTISRKGAEICGKGSAKLSWVCAVAGLSERGGRYARKELVHLGWIERDTGSRQWKLNRDGAYFSINLDWVSPVAAQQPAIAEEREFAPPMHANCPSFAPLYKDRKTPYGSKNQKAFGVSTKPEEGEAGDHPPNLRNVKAHDLFRLSRCEALYWQAVGEGILAHSESSALNFLSAALRARSVKARDPAKVFVAILRRNLWHHITADQEEVARRALARYREQNPFSFRVPVPPRASGASECAASY